MSKNKLYSLIGVDGNAFSVMAYVSDAMEAEGKSKSDIDEYYKKAKSGDYRNLLSVSMSMCAELNKMKESRK